MPQERENPYPDFNPAEIAELRLTTTREQMAARCVATRKFGGIPKATFMRGGCDHSAMMQGILDLTTAAFKLLDEIEAMNESHDFGTMLEGLGLELKGLLEDPG